MIVAIRAFNAAEKLVKFFTSIYFLQSIDCFNQFKNFFQVDAFKLYLLFKGHGRLELEEMIDNALDMSKYFAQKISNRPGFRLVIDNFEFTNVCFWYIPKCMRNMEENDDWWNYLFKVASLIKDRMVKSGGQLTISYSPLRHRGLGNFFRMITNCHPRPTYAEMDYVIEEIEKFGELLHDFD